MMPDEYEPDDLHDDRRTPTDDDATASASELPALAQEALLIELLDKSPGERVLCTSLGRAQLARASVATGRSSVACWYLDDYRAALAREAVRDEGNAPRFLCAADLPVGEVDLVALPTSSSGEAELTRELMQQGHERLAIGGLMLASTDNRSDRWLGDEMSKLFQSMRRHDSPRGTAYVATKTEPLKKLKSFTCEFAFRDAGRLIKAVSRPGVFAHRRIDPGARQLLAAMEVHAGERVIDIGCGSGTLSLAAALRAEGVLVHAVDSNARAVECTARGAALNALSNISVELNAHGPYAGRGTFDVALANPPYYASFRIAEHFLTNAREALRPGGRVWVVSKSAEWYAEQMPRWFDRIELIALKGYAIAQGVRP